MRNFKQGDAVKLFLSDETFGKFAGNTQVERAYCQLDIIYEDKDIVVINKPAGMLSQPADDGTPSLVEYLIRHICLDKGDLTEERAARHSVHLCATVWTAIPAAWYARVKAWQACSFCQKFFTTAPFINIICAW